MSLEVTISNEEKIKVTLTPVTSTGKPAKLDGSPSWSIISGAGTVEASDDGLSAYLISPDTDLGDTLYQIDADADLGSGVEAVSDIVTLHVIHANAKNLGVKAGKPEEK